MRTRLHAWAPPLAVCALGLFTSQCDLPSGCGPGAVTVNTYVSDMVDYTAPLSGEILERPRLGTFTVYFSEAVDRRTFSLADHMRVRLIRNFWDPEAPGYQVEEDVPGFFLPGVAWACADHRVCKPGADFKPDAADRLVLTVDPMVRDGFPEGATTPYYVLVELLAKCDDTPSPDEPCAASPLESHDGYPLEAPARVFVGIVNEGETSSAPAGPRPTLVSWAPAELAQGQGAYVQPHQRLTFTFSDQMGFVNFSPNELAGLNLRYREPDLGAGKVTQLESESSQGLMPGRRYELLFLSADWLPSASPGVPATMNRFGAALGSGASLEDPPRTQAFVFETSHVRILFPSREAFSDEPAAWDRQLEEWGYADPVVFVEVAPGVTRLAASLAGGETGIEFDDVLLDGLGGVVALPITRISGTPGEPTWRHRLRVHAFAGEEWRGADELEVFHCPYPQPLDPLPPFLSYQLSGPLYMDPEGAAHPRPLYDLDDDTLADALEAELAVLARPFLVLDEEEGCFFAGQDASSLGWRVVGDPTVFFQVRPVGRAGYCREANDEGRCVQQVRLTYVLTYQQDCGEWQEGHAEPHHGDTEPIEMLLRSTDGGVSWEVISVGAGAHGGMTRYDKASLLANLDPDPVQACVEEWPGQPPPAGARFAIGRDDKIYQCMDPHGGKHAVVLVAENKHGNYLRVQACVNGGDDCAGGYRVFAPLPDNFLDAQRYNVGEPVVTDDENWDRQWECNGDGSFDSHGQNLVTGDLGWGNYGFFFLEWIWFREYDGFPTTLPCSGNFCGGMRSAGMRYESSGDEYYHSLPEDFCIDTTSNCKGGIVEGKLAFDPFCSCQVFP